MAIRNNFIASFIPFMEKRMQIVEWEYSVDWYSGKGAAEIESSAKEPQKANHGDFLRLYPGIYQTINGTFVVTAKEGQVRLLVVDPTFWEIHSDIQGVEDECKKLPSNNRWRNQVLEPDAVKVARPVLRGESSSNARNLPD